MCKTMPIDRGLGWRCLFVYGAAASLWAAHAAPAAGEAADCSPAAEELCGDVGLSLSELEEEHSSLLLAAPTVALHYALSEPLSFSLDWGVAVLESSPAAGPSDSVTRPANPAFMIYLRPLRGLALGAGLALPAATIAQGGAARLHRAAYDMTAATEGLSRIWLWAPGRSAAIASAQLRLRVADRFELEAELWPAVLWQTRSSVSGQPVDFFMPSGLGLRWVALPVQPALRLSATWLATNEIDRLQLALEPGLRVVAGGTRMELRYVQNLGEPLAGARGPGLWGLHLGVGGDL